MGQVYSLQPHIKSAFDAERVATSDRATLDLGVVGNNVIGVAGRLIAALKARLAAARDRREIAAMGPFARRELDALLIGRGEGGIPLALWSTQERAGDAESYWPRCGSASDLRAGLDGYK